MPASTRFLTPHPPVLFSPPAKQVASGSTNSFSSASSSSNSRSANYFERLSRASGASAYLTDVTPPITPSNSNFEVEFKDRNSNRVLESSRCAKKPHPVVRPTILSDEDGGYRSDIDAIGNPGSGIPKSKRGTSRRPLVEVHIHSKDDDVSDSDDVGIDVPLLQEESASDLPSAEVPEVDGEAEMECFDEENFSRDFERAMKMIYQEVMNGTSTLDLFEKDRSTIPISPQVDLLGDESDVQIPTKPIIRALEVDSDCSPLSLCDDPSFESISRSLLSPMQPDPLPLSPAIYNDPPLHGNSPLSSPHMAISTFMFGARGGRRSFPMVNLTGENLDIASLIRLEIAAGNNLVHPNMHHQMGIGFHIPPQSHSPPSPFTSYPSLQSMENEMNPSPLHRQFVATSSPFMQNPSPVQDQKQTSVESGDFTRVRDVPLSPSPIDRDQTLVGLGLGALTEGCLRSSASITKLDSMEPRFNVSYANGRTDDIALDIQQCSPCKDMIEGNLETGIEPLCVLSGSESLQSRPSHTSAFYPEVQIGLASYQVNLGDNSGQVSSEGNVSLSCEHIIIEGNVESESEPYALSDSIPRTDVFSNLIATGRRCSIKSHKDTSSEDGDREGGNRCTTPLIVQAPTFTGQNAPSYLFDAVPITPDSTNLQSTSTLAENVPGAEPSTPKAHLAIWTDDALMQSIEHSSLLFQDSPLRRLTRALESDTFLARLDQSLASPPALSTASLGQKTGSGRLGLSSYTVSPKNDPRSPCSPSMEYFHPESYIRGCLGVLPSAQSSSGGANTPPLSSFGAISAAFPSFSGLLRESKSFEGLGLGLPSELVSVPLRQHGSSNQRTDDVDRLDTMSTQEECQNIAQLADTISSPNDGTFHDSSSHLLYQVPTFPQRRLYVIPEQPTPLSTFSAVRSRSTSPGNRPSESGWSAATVLARLRTSSRLTWRPFLSKRKDLSGKGDRIHDGRQCSSSSVDGHGFPVVEVAEGCSSPPSKKSTRFFKRIFRKIGSRRSECAPSVSSQSESGTVRSPGVIEHPYAPRGLNILTRQRRGRLDPITTKFRVLF